MKLYNANFSPNALRVRAVANELGIELEIIEVDIRAGNNRAADYLVKNANAKVPMLEDGDFVLWESRAICTYLAGLKPDAGLYPQGLKVRAIVDQWSWWQAVHLGPAMQKVSFERVLKSKFEMGVADQAVIDAEMKNVAQFLAVFNAALEGNDWIVGDLSVADFALASTFMYRKQAAISLDTYPNVESWITRLEERKSWQDAMAPLNALFGL